MHYPNRNPIEWCTLINPGIPITNVGSHHITDMDVADAPKFEDIAGEFATKVLNVDILAYNGQFDVDFLKAECNKARVTWDWKGRLIDPLQLYRKLVPHTLSNAYQRFVDPDGVPKREDGSSEAHDAGFDTRMAWEVLVGQLLEFKEIPRTIPELVEFAERKNPNAIDKTGKFIWNGDVPCINFGKHRGKPIKNVDQSYFVWMINSGNFPDDVVIIAGEALKGNYPTK